jgi:hypothetical protein
MLGIIAKFHDIEVPIIAREQMGLRPSAHLPDQACGFNGHEWGAKIILCARSSDGLH